jgi:hypothetical protein
MNDYYAKIFVEYYKNLLFANLTTVSKVLKHQADLIDLLTNVHPCETAKKIEDLVNASSNAVIDDMWALLGRTPDKSSIWEKL